VVIPVRSTSSCGDHVHIQRQSRLVVCLHSSERRFSSRLKEQTAERHVELICECKFARSILSVPALNVLNVESFFRDHLVLSLEFFS
jgi:hypothetical protein